MKVSKSTEEEIDNINNFLQELKWLSKDLQHSDLEDVDLTECKILKFFNKKDTEEFLRTVLKQFDGLYWEKALMNLLTLLENCADPDLNVLEFNPDIKKALELYNKTKEEDSGIDLITKERNEQIEKHGRTIEYDQQWTQHQLCDGAIELLQGPEMSAEANVPPSGFDEELWRKMIFKTYEERLVIAGALIAAELDRLKLNK